LMVIHDTYVFNRNLVGSLGYSIDTRKDRGHARHMMVTYVRGHFKNVSGSLVCSTGVSPETTACMPKAIAIT
jgi:hypothetical protein